MQAIFQVDDTVLNILKFAENSLHGFEIRGARPANCATGIVSYSPVSLRGVFLLLRLPHPTSGSNFPPLFGNLLSHTNRIRNWQQIVINFSSYTKDALLFLLFHQFGDRSAPLLGVELRRGGLYLATQKQSFEISTKQITSLRVGACKVAIIGKHKATIIAAGGTALEYFVAIDGDVFKKAFEAEVAGLLESAVEGNDFERPFGRNLLLGGSNWSAEGEMDRGLDHLWSGLGRRKYFHGCVYR